MGIKLQYNLENIGNIDKASITIKPLTIIAGENSSGKTFVTKSLYTVLDSVYKNHLLEEPINNILNIGFKKNNIQIASQKIKEEVRLKLSETLLLYYQLLQQCTFKSYNQSLKNKALLTVCKKNRSDVIIFAKLERELSRYYCPTHISSIKVIPYTELENIFSLK